ncbi:MAG: BrnT family toxin [Pseudochelatococcus sp.]|uniref:BrnT family toxin n=1 Tax=Pseudochelatococcus sp. TaxID=2020869 RepID=UPI003D92BECE
MAALFDWETATEEDDDRHDYGESRKIVMGFIGQRLHVMVCVYRDEYIRLISLRKANDREQKHYGNLEARRHRLPPADG